MSSKRPRNPGASQIAANPAPAHGGAAQSDNVHHLHMRVLPRHMEVVARWLEAGRVMGLCDAAPYRRDPTRPATAEHVIVWVRENADPAYKIAPQGMHWTVTDCVRDVLLARVRSFEAALYFIRPVLTLAGQPAWSPAAPDAAPSKARAGVRNMRAMRMSSPIDQA